MRDKTDAEARRATNSGWARITAVAHGGQVVLSATTARRLGEPHLIARLLAVRSFALSVGGDHTAAADDSAESLRLFRQGDDRLRVGTMLGNLGYVELAKGDLRSARSHLVESLDIFRELDDRPGVVYETFYLGLAEYLTGSPHAAESLFAESFDLARRARMEARAAYALIGLAMASGGTRAARLHGAADQALASLGETVVPLEGRLRDEDHQRLRAAMGAEAFQAEYAEGQALAPDQVVELALADRS